MPKDLLSIDSDSLLIVEGSDLDPDVGPMSRKALARQRLNDAGVTGNFDIVVCAALGYAA